MKVGKAETHHTVACVLIVDGEMTQNHRIVLIVSRRTDFALRSLWTNQNARIAIVVFPFFDARHHVRYQSCQRSTACSARAVHHIVAQIKDLYLPLHPGLKPLGIEPPPTELVSVSLNFVPRFDENYHEAHGGGSSRSRHHSGEL